MGGSSMPATSTARSKKKSNASATVGKKQLIWCGTSKEDFALKSYFGDQALDAYFVNKPSMPVRTNSHALSYYRHAVPEKTNWWSGKQKSSWTDFNVRQVVYFLSRRVRDYFHIYNASTCELNIWKFWALSLMWLWVNDDLPSLCRERIRLVSNFSAPAKRVQGRDWFWLFVKPHPCWTFDYCDYAL